MRAYVSPVLSYCGNSRNGLSMPNSLCRSRCSRVKLPGISEVSVGSNANLYPFSRRFLGHAGEDLPRNLRQHGIRKNVVDVTRAAFNFSAPLGNFLEDRIVTDHRDLMSFLEPALYFPDFQKNDLLQSLVTHRKIGNNNHAAEKRLLENIVKFRLDCQRKTVAVGHCLRVRGQLH